MSRNLQPGMHPDADRLSVFVEGAATAREQEKMLAHLAECSECRKAVFLMQPHEEPQRITTAPEKGWVWRWFVPVGLPAAALACGLIAVLIYIRPHGSVPETPQQIASVRPAETERPGTTVAPTSNFEQGAPTASAEQKERSGGRQNAFAAKGAATNLSRQESQNGGGLNLPGLKNEQATAGVPPPTTAAAPTPSAPAANAAKGQGGGSAGGVLGGIKASELPLNGRNVTEPQQIQPADKKGAASRDTLANNKELPTLQIQGASAQAQVDAGISGRITDRSGAIIAGVEVTLRDVAGKTRQTTTGADGSFHLTQLPAGQYELSATAAGFKTSKQSIELKPSELAMLQPVLDLGTASETVEVSSSAVSVETQSANVSGQVVAEINGMGRVTSVPSGLPVAASVSHGMRFLSLDNAGNVFLSRNGGKKWKKIKPQWTGKAVRIELRPEDSGQASAKAKNEGETGAASKGALFLLTTDGGTVWTSKDGAHWHQQ